MDTRSRMAGTQMKALRIKDNSVVRKESLSDISALTNRIANKTLKQLEREGLFVFPELLREAEDLSEDQMILQSVNDTYRSGNVMGFLGCGNERLVIESRFSEAGQDYFFSYLLNRILDFPNMVNMETDTDQENKLFYLLLFLFPHYLKAAMRKGPFKTYILNRYNDNRVKGTIDVTGHIKKNTPFVGKVAYSQREYSYDNALMELVRHTIEFIKRKPYGRNLLTKVKNEVQLVDEATQNYRPQDKRKVILENKQNIIRHAYYREYRALQQLCMLILQHQKHQIGSGSRQIYGILFDGAWLWEEYIATLIGELFYHPKNKAGSGGQRLFAGNTGHIYPDFISKRSDNRVIADAKYKPMDHIGNRDYLQLLAYMFRFDAKIGFYLYPEAADGDDLILRMNQGSTYEGNVGPRNDVLVIKHGLKIPNITSDYESFEHAMHASEEDFKKIFASVTMINAG
jgi:5-methylcytosine-specific restriction endonuclease McrBC regulatory subunit McrC